LVGPGTTAVSGTFVVVPPADSLGSVYGTNGNSGTLPTSGFNGNITMANPGPQDNAVGDGVFLDIGSTTTDVVAGATLTYGAIGLPLGLRIDTVTGLISGAPTADTQGPANVTVWATDQAGNAAKVSFTWTVHEFSLGAVAAQTNTEGASVALALQATSALGKP